MWASSAPHLKGMAPDLAIIVNGDIIALIQCAVDRDPDGTQSHTSSWLMDLYSPSHMVIS
jgi:hypothetical protein